MFLSPGSCWVHPGLKASESLVQAGFAQGVGLNSGRKGSCIWLAKVSNSYVPSSVGLDVSFWLADSDPNAGSGKNVRIGLTVNAVTSGTTLSTDETAFTNTEYVNTVTMPTTKGAISTTEVTIPSGNCTSVSAGSLVMIRLRRLGDDALDTNFGQILVLGINVPQVGKYPSDLSVASGSVTMKHLVATGTHPSIAAGAAAGTTPGTPTVVGSDLGGIITVITGTTALASGVLATVTFNAAYAAAPKSIQLTPANAATAALSGTKLVWADSAAITTALFTLNTGSTAPDDGATYAWYYQVVG